VADVQGLDVSLGKVKHVFGMVVDLSPSHGGEPKHLPGTKVLDDVRSHIFAFVDEL